MSTLRYLRLCGLDLFLVWGAVSCGGDSPNNPGDGGGGSGGGGGAGADSTSTYRLIDDALNRGDISLGTSLLYKFQSIYEPELLDPSLRGGSVGPAHDALYEDLLTASDQLSPAEVDAVMPYLVPAFVQGSWWDQRRARKEGKSVAVPCIPWQQECPVLSDWGYIDAGSGNYRVWFESGVSADSLRAIQIASAMDAVIAPTETGLMNRQPSNDWPWGSSAALDILVINLPGGILGWTKPLPRFPMVCDSSPTFVEIGSGVSGPALLPTVAHEFFHVLQWTYSMSGCGNSYSWLREATATWAQDFVYPSSQLEQTLQSGGQTFPEAFLTEPQRPLDYQTTTRPHKYGAYLFFQYLSKTFSPNWIRTIWEQAGSGPPLAAIDAGLRAAGSTDFSERWPQFARFLWNQDSEDHFVAWDNMRRTPTLAHAVYQPSLSASTHDTIRFAVDLPHLSCRYDRVLFTNDDVSGFWFLNGWSQELSEANSQSFPGRTHYEFTALDPAEARLRSVQLLYRMRGSTTWEYQDLTTTQAFYFCRDQVAGRVDEAVLIFANADYRADSAPRQPTGLAPFIWYDSIGCEKWTGTIRQTVTGTPTGEITADLIWQNQDISGPQFISNFPSSADLGTMRFLPTSGRFDWTITGDDGSGCTTNQSGGWNQMSATLGTQLLFFDLVPSGRFTDRLMANIIDVATRAPTTINWACPDPNNNYSDAYIFWPIITDPSAQLPALDSTGKAAHTTLSLPDGRTTIRIDLTAVREVK